MHHLILVRAGDPESGSIGCCCRISRDDVRWNTSAPSERERDEASVRFGELYRTLRTTFGDRLRITVVDPRNMVSFVPLVARDAIRNRVPLRAALRAMGATSFATGVLDGRVLFHGCAPPAAEVVDLIEGRIGGHPAHAR